MSYCEGCAKAEARLREVEQERDQLKMVELQVGWLAAPKVQWDALHERVKRLEDALRTMKLAFDAAMPPLAVEKENAPPAEPVESDPWCDDCQGYSHREGNPCAQPAIPEACKADGYWCPVHDVPRGHLGCECGPCIVCVPTIHAAEPAKP